MSKNDQENLARARHHIQQKDFAAARAILKQMPNNPTAQEWLIKLDRLISSTPAKPAKQGRSLKGLIGGVGIVLCLGLAAGVILIRALGSDTTVVDESGRSTNRAIEAMTATIIALTPTSTPTQTFTPSPSFTPSMTFTPLPTNPGIVQNTLPPTWTPAPSLTSMPLAPSSNSGGSTTGTRYITQEVNVRSGPGTTYDRLGTLPLGYAIRVLEEQAGWYRISFNSQEGWVAGQYTSREMPPISSNTDSGNSSQPPPCNCNGSDLDCADFSTHAQAQACFNYCVSTVGFDVFQLDGEDDDGSACERLP